ncbi:hypothetical protein B0T16DRAFT_500097 [Cercophora newfieldiana]|uniref:C2H2-type domain-containing protein n=1 Tax=Cercophora newfieldiana TaxID=92897 RepID=A0AA39YNY7_9PEZI|nr:hypothetical protein B0T16DRAFT_500097 [Cercophora newfieldiana]
MEAPSFASRRPAATGLPAFTLPLPPPPSEIPSTRYPNHSHNHNQNYNHTSATHTMSPRSSSGGSSSPWPPSLLTPAQYPPYSSSSPPSTSTTTTTSTSTTARIASILTPSSGAGPDGLTPSPGVNTGSSQSTQPGANNSSMFYSITGAWSTPQPSSSSSAYTYNSTVVAGPGPLAQPPQFQQPRHSPLYGSQPSPSVSQFSARHSSSPANGDTLPHPPGQYQDHSQYSGQSGSGGSGGGGSGGGGGGGAGSLGHGHGHGHPQHQQPSQASAPSPGAQESAHFRQPPAPSYHGYPPSSTTPQQSSFPSFQGPGAAPQPSPTGAPSPKAAPTSAGGLPQSLLTSSMRPPHLGGYSSRPMPPMTSYATHYGPIPGPVLSNMHQPGAPLSMVGGGMGAMTYGHHIPYGMHHPGHAHGHHAHGGPQTQDRPFKCDTCPQSFNRNHDLKRHKRIHLAVKPFPCNNCDKSFSRKDALKRHKLVKGCGNKGDNNNNNNNSHTASHDANYHVANGNGNNTTIKEESPPDGDDNTVITDDSGGSPRTVKKE